MAKFKRKEKRHPLENCPMADCPQYKWCSAPKCPLDRDMKKRKYFRGEPKCTLSKAKRMELGKDLPNKGLFPKELAGYKAWEKRNHESKQSFNEEAKKHRFKKGFARLVP